MSHPKKIVLAYSGGLDTSVIIAWLKEKYNAQVIAVVADVGQGEDMEAIKEKALKTGASRVYVEDLKEEFASKYVLPVLKANALYEGKYPLISSLSRPIISQHMVEIAKEEGADALSHGCTGKGNDQVRFDTAFHILSPDLEILAPLRMWEFTTREEEMLYAKEKGIPVSSTKESPYSIDCNLWGRSIECGILEDPWQEPPLDIYTMTTDPQSAPEEPEYLEISYKEGIPTALDGEEMSLLALIKTLNVRAGNHGIGRVDMVENRVVGIKSREIYEVPGATLLYLSHKELEDMVLDRNTLYQKEILGRKYADLIYDGLYFTPLREAIWAFVQSTQKYVEGRVRLRLYKGQAVVVGRTSPRSIYQEELATYDTGDTFSHESAEGFIELFSLPYRVMAQVNRGVLK